MIQVSLFLFCFLRRAASLSHFLFLFLVFWIPLYKVNTGCRVFRDRSMISLIALVHQVAFQLSRVNFNFFFGQSCSDTAVQFMFSLVFIRSLQCFYHLVNHCLSFISLSQSVYQFTVVYILKSSRHKNCFLFDCINPLSLILLVTKFVLHLA